MSGTAEFFMLCWLFGIMVAIFKVVDVLKEIHKTMKEEDIVTCGIEPAIHVYQEDDKESGYTK